MIDPWRARARAGACAAAAALALAGCSAGADTDSNIVPQTEAGSGSTTPASQPECPQLTAQVPADLTKREELAAESFDIATSVATIWSTPNGRRVVNLSSEETVEIGSHEMGGTREEIRIGDTTALHEQNEDIDRVTWQPADATAPCVRWAVVAQGLTPAELTDVLASVKEGAERTGSVRRP